jgi:hypothetical protein
LFLDQLAHQFHSGRLIAPSLHQQIENLAFVVNRAPQPELPARNDHGQVSGAEELRPRALSEPDVILSYHPAFGVLVCAASLSRRCPAQTGEPIAPRRSLILSDVRDPTSRRGRCNVERLLAECGDAKLTDLLATLADCAKARSVSVHDRCEAVYDGTRRSCR